jgi:hypothetical protein
MNTSPKTTKAELDELQAAIESGRASHLLFLHGASLVADCRALHAAREKLAEAEGVLAKIDEVLSSFDPVTAKELEAFMESRHAPNALGHYQRIVAIITESAALSSSQAQAGEGEVKS